MVKGFPYEIACSTQNFWRRISMLEVSDISSNSKPQIFSILKEFIELIPDLYQQDPNIFLWNIFVIVF